MSPSALAPEPSFKLTPIAKSVKDKTDFGVTAEGLDLNNISGMDHTISMVDTCDTYHKCRWGCSCSGRCYLDTQGKPLSQPQSSWA